LMANALSFIRALIGLVLVPLLLRGEEGLSLLLVVFGALTDFLDGLLARRRSPSRLGLLLDPFADKVFVLLPLVALVELGRVSSLPVALLLFRELAVLFLRSYRAFPSSFLGKVKTLLSFLALFLLVGGFPFGKEVLYLAVVLAYLSLFGYLKGLILKL